MPPPIQAPLSSSILNGFYGPYGLPRRPAQSLDDAGGGANETQAGSSRGDDAERIRRYQEEEFQRRLRGEYEATQERLGQVVMPK